MIAAAHYKHGCTRRLVALWIVCVAALVLAASGFCAAATYYVDPDGSDGNPGTQTQPWQTIGHGDAIGVLAPGDTVLVRPGTYGGPTSDGVLLTKCSGATGQPITYRADGAVIVQGNAEAAKYGFRVKGDWVLKPHDIVIDGFEITGCAFGVAVEYAAHNVTVRNCNIHDLVEAFSAEELAVILPRLPVPSAGIRCYLSPDCTITGNTIHDYGYSQTAHCAGVLVEVSANALVTRNTIHDIGNPESGRTSGAINVRACTNARVYHNTAAYCGNLVRASYSTSAVVAYNIAYEVTQNCIMLEANGDASFTTRGNLFSTYAPFYGGEAKQGIGDLLADAGFVDANSRDFGLADGSLAINAGVDVGVVSFQGPAPDLGASESASTAGVGFVAGRVTADQPGNPPIAGAEVGFDDGSAITYTDADGLYSLPAPAGTVSLTAYSGDYTPSGASVEIASGQTTTQDFALIPPPTTGRNYYVNDSTGDDANSGDTPETAWKTIQHGDSNYLLASGDTVFVAAGTYPQADYLGVVLGNCSGVAGSPITYKAQGNVVIDQSNTPGETGRGDLYGFSVSADYVTIDGFEVRNCVHGIQVVGDYDRVTNCVIHDMHYGNESDFYATWCSGVFLGDDDVIPGLLVSNALVDHNVIYNIGTPGVGAPPDSYYGLPLGHWAAGVFVDLAPEATVANNTVYNAQAGIHYWNPSTTVTNVNNLIVHTWWSGIDTLAVHNPSADNKYNMCWDCPVALRDPISIGAGNVIADPLFADAAAHDFSLLAGSLAINSGIDVGLPFNGPAPDRGAIESGSSAPPSQIKGIVTANKPGHPALVGVTVSTQDGRTATTGSDGSYVLLVPAGAYTLTASLDLAVPGTTSVTVAVGEVKEVNFDLDLNPGKTYYVNDVTGSDDYDGLSATYTGGTNGPWKTIQNGDAKSLLKPGDTVLIAAGTYPQTTGDGVHLINCPGASVAPITYKSASGLTDIVIDCTTSPEIEYYGGAYKLGIHLDVGYTTIDGFEIKNTRCFGVWTGSGIRSVTFRNCSVHDVAFGGGTDFGGNAYGTYVAAIDELTVEKCLFYNIGYPLQVPDPDGTKQSYALMSTRAGAGDRIVNNTFDSTWTGILAYGWTTFDDVVPMTVANNIFSNMSGAALEIDQAIAGFNNLYWNDAAYTAYFGIGSDSVMADPLFTNAAGSDFTLQTGSPAIDKGADVGLAYSGLAPDIGAFETAGGTPPTDYTTIGAVKSLADGTTIRLTVAMVATAASSTFQDGSYYIEQPDRSCGVKVLPRTPTTVAAGDGITLTGVMATDANGERYIDATAVTVTPSSAVSPVGLNNKAAAGVIGLLARVWGEVKTKTTTYAIVEDGSPTGVRVELAGLNTALQTTLGVGDYVAVTGPVGLGPGGVITVKPRSDDDISIF